MTDRAPPPAFRVLACPAGGGDGVLVLVVAGALGGADGALADRVEALLAAGAHVVVDVTRIDRADVGAVAALARLQLRMRARGGSIRLRGASTELRTVLVLLGLDRALPADDGR